MCVGKGVSGTQSMAFQTATHSPKCKRAACRSLCLNKHTHTLLLLIYPHQGGVDIGLYFYRISLRLRFPFSSVHPFILVTHRQPPPKETNDDLPSSCCQCCFSHGGCPPKTKKKKTYLPPPTSCCSLLPSFLLPSHPHPRLNRLVARGRFVG